MKTSPRTAFFLKAICCLVLTATLVFFNGCKKIDTPLEQPAPIDHSEPFFRLPTATNASVARVAAALQNLNTQQEFVNRFAKQYGFPVWDKVFALNKPNPAGSSFAGTVGADTLIYIPLVLQGDTVVNGFIRARLNDSITLNYSLASDYKSYPEVRRDSLPSSKDFALLIMKLNQLTFGYNEFLLTDSSLFKQTKTTAFGSQPTQKMVRFKNHTGPSLLAGSGTNNVLIQSYCEDIVISICATNTSTPLQGNIQSITTPGGGGNCYNDFVEVCWDIITFTPGGGENPVPGGEPTGGGGGGGNGLPHYYPCPGTGNPFTAPICPPPGGGLGWVPLPVEEEPTGQDPCIIANNAAKKMDTLFNECRADSVLATIPNLTTETKEMGFPIYKKITISSTNPQDTTSITYSSGNVQTGTESSITISSTTTNLRFLAGLFHTHPGTGYAAHSTFDIYELIEKTLQNNHYQGSFVAAANGSQFAVNITDYAKAAAFLTTKSEFLNGTKWNEASTIGKAFDKAKIYFESAYKGRPNQTNLAYEMAMAAVLAQFNTGITFTKKDAAGNFKPIVVKTASDPQKPKRIIYTQDCL